MPRSKKQERWLEEMELAWAGLMLLIAVSALVLLVGVLLWG